MQPVARRTFKISFGFAYKRLQKQHVFPGCSECDACQGKCLLAGHVLLTSSHTPLTVTWGMCSFVMTCFITSMGHGEPPIMPKILTEYARFNIKIVSTFHDKFKSAGHKNEAIGHPEKD